MRDRLPFHLTLLVAASWMTLSPLDGADQLPEMLRSHCVDCHDPYTTEGEFDLTDLLDGKLVDEQRARALVRMQERVEAGEMPPVDSDTLTLQDRHQLVELLTGRLDGLAEKLKDDPGDVAMARLTPYEYRNVIRDLSGGVVTDAGRLLPNEGGAGEGFSNVGAAQVMTLTQLEKYVDAAKDALQHLRLYPTLSGQECDRHPSLEQLPDKSLTWKSYPRQWVDQPAEARKEVVDEIIAWHVAQQQKWGEEHRKRLGQQLGFVHAAYMEAAWNYGRDHASVQESGSKERGSEEGGSEDSAQRARDRLLELAQAVTPFASITDADGDRIDLAPVALAKWVTILNSERKDSPHAQWAKAWRELPGDLSAEELRRRCRVIVGGEDEVDRQQAGNDYAPPYEISFQEANEEVLETAEQESRWPFRIKIGDAKELFLVVTDAGDGGQGEYAKWHGGRFLMKDGSWVDWEELVTVVGANSGRKFRWGFDGANSKTLGDDAIGAAPPGALKFRVPENAVTFEVDLSVDQNLSDRVSIQALVLRKKPKSSSYIPGRAVFGGKKRSVSADQKLSKEQSRALRKRNVAEANRTKIGLNAERNVFARWQHSSLEAIGGPWPDQAADEFEPEYPYHYTVPEVLVNATEQDLRVLERLKERLVSLLDDRPESLLRRNARRVIQGFAEVAWRRPVREEELTSLIGLYEENRNRKMSFDSAVKSSLLAVLGSPHFLYRSVHESAPAELSAAGESEDAVGRNRVALTSKAIASRLSFFLWGSVPDPTLRTLAAEDRLQDPDVLVGQVHRMLADPRARSLATDFAGQMWSFNDFENFDNPDEEKFPEFTPQLRQSMLEEVTVFIDDLIRNDRPLTNLINADYTFVTPKLARHYGVDVSARASSDERHASGLIRVKLPADRGGLVTMGLFLTKTSLPLRTSPVQRGVWLMESVLGRELPNPPASVDPLSEDEVNAEGLNIRQQLEIHRADAGCASCHDKIDPLGVSLEGFDPIGRSIDVDVQVTTHDGTTLNGSKSLREYLRQHEAEFFRHFNRKLLGYALGRATHVGDRELLHRMDKRLRDSGYRFSAVVEEVVTSEQFRTRKADSR